MRLCYGCGSRCCKELRMELTSFDIYRIWRKTGIEPERFVDFEEAGDEAYFLAEGKKWRMVLRRGNRGCVFLSPSDSLGCSIEQIKPGSCLLYPYEFRGSEVKVKEPYHCGELPYVLLPPPEKIDKYSPREREVYLEDMRNWNFNGGRLRGRIEYLEHCLTKAEENLSLVGKIVRRLW